MEYLIIGILCLIIFVVFLIAIKVGKIRNKLYGLFLEAEHGIVGGENKLNYCLENLYSYLPNIMRIFISLELFCDLTRKIVNNVFLSVKDLLDDGKYNKSAKEEV